MNTLTTAAMDADDLLARATSDLPESMNDMHALLWEFLSADHDTLWPALLRRTDGNAEAAFRLSRDLTDRLIEARNAMEWKENEAFLASRP